MIAQSASTAYMLCKDIFLYAKGQKRDIENLEERMSKLIINLISIKSEKERIDRSLMNSPSMEPTQAYTVMEAEIEVIGNKCTNLIERYAINTSNQLVSAPLDAETASSMIEKLGDLRTKIVTLSFLKLAKLSRDVSKLSARASEAVEGLKPERMTQKKSEPNEEKLEDDGHVLPVFDTYVDDIVQYLFEEKGKMVGILGCQGAGKTTVLRKLYDRLLEQKYSSSMVDRIIRVELPPETEAADDILALQNEIMMQLKLDHEVSQSTVVNENTISKFLRDRKYILLIDGVSRFIDFETLGLKRGHEHRKVVISSRNKNCLVQMTEHEFEIRGLDEGEALKLFKSIYGEFHDQNIEGVANRMIECCQGIPWMIRELAMILRGEKDKESWHHALRILQSEIKSNGFIRLDEFDKVYKIAYGRLEKNTKKCLLYGALFPHHYKIYTDYLIECWIAEGFISENSPQKVRLSRGVGKNILNCLTQKDLLRWNPGKKYVTMPPHFRRVALELGYSDEEGCAVWVPSVDRTPDPDAWNRVTRMSLIGCSIMELPQIPECSNLQTLFLQSLKPELEELADSFFSRMESLRVLDLNDTGIGALPKSINVLVNLKSLYLKGCSRLVALTPEVAELQKLEFLDFRGTSVPTLPKEIGSLINMRCLRVSLSLRAEEEDVEPIIPEGVISRLTNLEELIIDVVFDFQGWIGVAERVAIEMAKLAHLNTLCFNFPNVSSLNTFVTHSMALNNKQTRWSANTFRSFKISVGSHVAPRFLEPEFSAETWLRYSTNEEFSSHCHEILEQASAFEIVGGYDGLNSLTSSQFDSHPVKICVVESCKDLTNIMDGYIINERQDFFKVSLLQNLEKLHLYNLESLQCIWFGPVPLTTLANLTTITINGCPKLTKVLDPPLARSLHSLEYLKVQNCCQISKIIQESDGGFEIVEEQRSNSDLLRRLAKMELLDLPELISVCETTPMRWNSLKSIIVKRCSKLRDLSLIPKNCRKLQSIQCEESWWNTLTTQDEVQQHLLRFCCFKDESTERGGGASSSGRSAFRADENETLYGDDLQAAKATEGGIQINGNSHDAAPGV